MGLVKGDTRSLDYSPNKLGLCVLIVTGRHHAVPVGGHNC